MTRGRWLSCAVAVLAFAASAAHSQALTPLPSKVVVQSDVIDAQIRFRRGDSFNGYRGYRYYRPGYRYYRGLWYPRAAFRREFIRPPMRLNTRHIDWCYDRYRSYRASDNTYQPYNGPRRQCYSPYN